MLNIYIVSLILLALLSANFLLTQKIIPDKYRPLPIVSHLVGCVIMIPLVVLVVKNQWHMSIPTIGTEPFLKTIQNVLGAVVLGFILLELSHVKPTKQMLTVASFSCALPVVGALVVCAILGILGNIQLTVSLMCVFAISAVPVLYLYLKQLNVDSETMKLLMGVAILIDMLAWLAFGFVSSNFSIWALIGCITLGFVPLLINPLLINLEQKQQVKLMAFLFFALFVSLYIIKTYALIFAILYLFNLQKLNIVIENIIPPKLLQLFFNFIAIPLLFIFAALSISWSSVLKEMNWQEFGLLLCVPIILKVLGSWLGLKLIGWKNAWTDAWLLNTRGLTEIVFLNILLSSAIILPSQYLALLLMSLVATMAPGLLKKKKMLTKEKVKEVDDKIKSCVDKLNAVYNFNMLPPQSRYDVTGTTAGLAKSKSMTVHFNVRIALNNWEDFVENVVPHEVAHIAVWHWARHLKRKAPSAHGATWKLMMWHIGANARRTHSYDVEDTKRKVATYEYSCGCSQPIAVSSVIHNKIKVGAQYSCKKCNQPLTGGIRKSRFA